MQNDSFTNELVNGILNKEFESIATDITEISLDTFLEENFLRELPVVGTFIRLVKGVITIKDKIFFVKVARFLFSLNKIAIEERNLLLDKCEDEQFKERLGETLFLILEKLDDLEKPIFIAKIFLAYIKDEITFTDFKRLATAIQLAYIDDLNTLIGKKEPIDKYSELVFINLIHAGLSEFEINNGWYDVGKISYRISPLGNLLIKSLGI